MVLQVQLGDNYSSCHYKMPFSFSLSGGSLSGAVIPPLTYPPLPQMVAGLRQPLTRPPQTVRCLAFPAPGASQPKRVLIFFIVCRSQKYASKKKSELGVLFHSNICLWFRFSHSLRSYSRLKTCLNPPHQPHSRKGKVMGTATTDRLSQLHVAMAEASLVAGGNQC